MPAFGRSWRCRVGKKATYVRNEVFLHLKKSNKMAIKINLTPDQRRVLKELKEDEMIIICLVNKGKAVAVEDREAYMAMTQDQIHEGIICYPTRVKDYITKLAQEIDGSAGGNEENRFQGAEEVCSDWSCHGIDSVVGKGP